MLAHFLRRDFRDFLIWWVFLVVITVGVVVANLLRPRLPGFALLLWVYVMFEMSSVNHVLGSVWRTQHQASRYYLLSLPLSHRTLFAIQHARLAVFWLPLIALCGVGPRWDGQHWPPFGGYDWALYYFALLTSVALVMEVTVRSTLDMERIASYVPRGQRVWAWASTFIVTFGVMALLGVAWVDLFLGPIPLEGLGASGPFGLLPYWKGSSRILFPISLVLAVLGARWNARRWCVTL
jgi:hypothetical protein